MATVDTTTSLRRRDRAPHPDLTYPCSNHTFRSGPAFDACMIESQQYQIANQA